ncbi:MAG: CrcB family protein, partial [Bifidobacterium pseudocatenulatum]|nr:CrcB family protein [Bifidobacterium pseudocatenulatum]
STALNEVVSLIRQRRFTLALGYGIATVAVPLICVATGFGIALLANPA